MNTGCIPTKTLVRSAEIIHHARIAHRFGARVPAVEVDFPAIMARKNRRGLQSAAEATYMAMPRMTH